METNPWAEFSENYDEKVYSLTKIPQRRKQILERTKGERVLNLGTGPTPYLNHDLVKNGYMVVASDFCSAMLDVAKREFTHPRLEYVSSDSRNLSFSTETFDSVISVNSILPETRAEVDVMVQEAYRVLRFRGVFVAFLCPYDFTRKAIKILGLKIQVDSEQMRVFDTTGWQCFHTPESISEMVQRAGFGEYSIKKVFLKTKQEVAQLSRLYGVDASLSFYWEYLLSAYKR